MDTGQAIKTLRMKAGLTQEQLAEKCGMSISGISYLETGRSIPPKATIEKMIERLEEFDDVQNVYTNMK